MRVAMLNSTARQVGGAETYLTRLALGLAGRGHQVALLAETDGPAGRPPVQGVERLAPTAEELAHWRPDVLINHGLEDPSLEAACLGVAPALLVAHNYYGTCISGSKTFTFPTVRPCSRRLGYGCLALYYPRRTGGLSPATLAERWRVQRRRQALLRRYRHVLVFSRHMEREFGREVGARARLLPFPMAGPAATDVAAGRPRNRLLYVGRLEPLKGVALLLDAVRDLPDLALTIVGDGRERAALERQAAARPSVTFRGWLDDVEPSYRAADLVVLPSLWPEPFGQVGLEAARFGVPATAFPVGGIREWLEDGRNGTLAERPADAGALARAIRRALDPSLYPVLAGGARGRLASHTMDRHLDALEALW